MQKKEFQAVVFDMDGVIFDSERMVILCWQEVADKYQIDNVEAVCRRCLGMNREASKEEFLQQYGRDFPYDAYKAEMSALFHERCSGGRLPKKKGVVELLTALKQNGKKIALASSTRLEIVKKELKDAGIMDYFDVIIGGDMVEKSKPEPDIYLKACECLQLQPADTYAIEDSYNGVRSAYRAGMHTIMVPDLAVPTKEMEELSEEILDSLECVISYLDLHTNEKV